MLHRKKSTAKKYSATIEVNGSELPVLVVFEPRNGHRYSITNKRITMRLPAGINSDAIRQHLANLTDWVSKMAAKKQSLLEPFTAKTYQTGDILTIGTRTYTLLVDIEDRATHSGRLLPDGVIALQLSERASLENRQIGIRTLLSRIVAGDYMPEITRRVHAINERTFRQPIKGIALKHNHSNWGSCSRGGNINLSTRLLFAPTEVQDYVILHELAHLVELNHSDRFWHLVVQHMPDYEQKEQWLRQHGKTCNF